MLVKQAKEIARQWVLAEAGNLPGFRGAFLHGSINGLPDDTVLPATSDVDIMVVLDTPEPPEKPGKLPDQGVLLEISYLPLDQLRDAEQVLGVSHLAGSFRTPGILLDPTGALTQLQAAVASNFARRKWVVRRCEHAQDKSLACLRALDAPAPFPEQVIKALFGTGLTTHVLLAAGLKNLTVRKRYLAARELLAEYGYSDFYPALLDVLGCAQMPRARCEQHLARLAQVFDAAKTVLCTPFYFASDLSDRARPIAIDGSRELIESGSHREAVFWLAVTYSRCQIVLAQDAPAGVQEQFRPGYMELLADLGLGSIADLQQRRRQVQAFLPYVWQVAQAIIAANPEILEFPL
jgi:hypothetical protein